MKIRGISKKGFRRIEVFQRRAQAVTPDDPRYPGFSDEFYQALGLISVDALLSEEDLWQDEQIKLVEVIVAEAARKSGEKFWEETFQYYYKEGLENAEAVAQQDNLSLMDYLIKQFTFEIHRGDREIVQDVAQVAVEYLEGPSAGSVHDSQILDEIDYDWALEELNEWAEEPETQQRIRDFLGSTGKVSMQRIATTTPRRRKQAGFFSWNCHGCGKSLRSTYSNSPDWMMDVVVLEKDGKVLEGMYDGYGNVAGEEIGVIWSETGSEYPSCWHRRCWEAAGRPEYADDGPSTPAEDQGYFV